MTARWNPDKPHRCPACHTVAITGRKPSPWRVYTCCACGLRFCRWHEDIDGTRYLIPGCMTRIHNPDADPCDCPTVNEQLTKAREEIDALRRKRDSLQSWHDQVTRAVYDHRDGVQIMHAAARAAGAAAPEGGAR